MLFVQEKNISNEICYQVKTIINNEEKYHHLIHCKASTVKLDGKIYYLLFDKYYKVIDSVYFYLNVYLPNLLKSSQTISKSLVALKYLYSYLSIFNIELETMTYNDSSKFIRFLMGHDIKGEDIVFEFNSIRTASSINDYLSLIRQYIKYLHLEKHPLLATQGKNKINRIVNKNEYQANSDTYTMKLKEIKNTTVPKHITLEEYKTMLNYVQGHNDKRTECIIRLMYESGMRIGSVLGLTFEDIKQVEKPNGKFIYKIISRNRFGNKVYQFSKFLMKIEDKKQYNTKAYRQKDYGYQETYISESLYNLLMEYLDDAHSEQQDKNFERWKECTVTDTVDSEFDEEFNFFVFINKWGKPLSNKTLYKDIKNLFIECNVSLNDDGGKFDGLCHRFRHGFAMFQIKYNHTPLLVLKELMHHSSIESTLIYYTPEENDLIYHKNEISKNLYEYIYG